MDACVPLKAKVTQRPDDTSYRFPRAMSRQPIRYRALATDYDGTLASAGAVDSDVLEGLGRVRASGRRLVLVTGRQVTDLLQVCPDLTLFDRVVAENGAVVYRPETGEEVILAQPPSRAFVDRLRREGVTPLSIGRVVVATHANQQAAVRRAIDEIGPALEMIFNRDSLMVLPPGVNKGTGLLAALDEIGISPSNVVGIGDAENDDALLAACARGIAVANAIPPISECADFVCRSSNGRGILEIVEQLLSSDLATIARRRRPSKTRRSTVGDVEPL